MNNEFNLEKERARKLDEIYKKYDYCEHKDTELRKRAFKNNSIHYVSQCMSCGVQVESFKKSTALKNNPNQKLFDEDIKLNWESQREQKINAVIKIYGEEKQKTKDKFWGWYSIYLKSSTWRDKRELVLRRDNYTCQGCLRKKATQVHHLTYENVGDELLFELVSLCDSCHEKAHKNEHQLQEGSLT
ncbi:HNH endonuclease [Xenorhabdus bovienii]|uniref:HNH endonuclease n=1 Tax=Xenorhabdus bovienii TaxID=40576 RepID=UPI00237CFDBD|nr:hypothetical protein [Xenorhabdus bovienii]MDE1484738.1 hypothetical protein [Xenorhabdus bovienii]